ncbi:DUF4474 domain-containing protein [Amycolatopsis rhabdoformis]|uniref:DUF4474 domain-containing protein n=1 Tax=Amycolatopsis rhabdoformis TaxID=1448059 RepID=A0ABZ1IDV2_9PSEU|nr:DUF4474 domain-containing protein [Amycolatopsis rhabdoformis]WSE32102.1 DUF4474 domain-containing protein [Amycolatopsis rhabdoformis]
MTSVFDRIRDLAGKVESGSTTDLDDRARACRVAKGAVEDAKALLENVRTQLSESWHGGAGESALASLDDFKKNREDQAHDLEESAKSFEVVRDALAKAQSDARSKREDAEAMRTKLDNVWNDLSRGKGNMVFAWAQDKVIKAEALVVLIDLQRVVTTYDAVLLAEGLKLRNKTGQIWELAGSEKRNPAEIAAIILKEIPGLAALVAKNPKLDLALLRGDWDTIMRDPDVAQKIYDYFGFKYNENGDFYTTGEHSVQSYLGWHDLYDKMGKIIGADLDETNAGGDNMEFTDPKTGKVYRLELWKGSYGFGSAFGGEVGFYTRDPNSTDPSGYFNAAKGDDQIKVTQQIYDKQTGKVYFSNDGQGADGTDKRHFWNLAIRSEPGHHAEQLGQRATIEVRDTDMRDRIYNEMTRYAAAHPEEHLTVHKVSDNPPVLSYDWQK